jgi:predicted acylesterase/phospholipase RssA/predicted transposase YbfD/YdcC
MTRSTKAGARSLREYLAEVPDHRQNNRVHPLAAVLALSACAMLCGARSLYAVAQWGRDHGGEVAQALGFRREKTPCVATLHNVLKAVDIAAFEAALSRWLSQAQPPAGGERSSRRWPSTARLCAAARAINSPACISWPPLARGWGCPFCRCKRAGDPGRVGGGQGVARQARPGGRGDYRRRPLCAKRTLRAEHKKRGAYLLSVKANQADLQEAIRDFFAHAPPAGVRVSEASHTGAHADRVETRTLRASAGLNDYLLGWAGLGQVLFLERRVWQRGRGERLETACAITSLLPEEASAEELLALWRGHWGIETRLHYVRDVTLGEDACRVRSGHAPQALAAVRNSVQPGAPGGQDQRGRSVAPLRRPSRRSLGCHRHRLFFILKDLERLVRRIDEVKACLHKRSLPPSLGNPQPWRASMTTIWPEHLAPRFATERLRKLLALDGGGIRGVLSLEILVEMERQIRQETGIERLGDYFDYIGGTSTGSIIAAGLAIGMSAQELLDFYQEFGRQMFEKTALLERITSLLSSLYQDEPIARKLKEIFHDGADPNKSADLTTQRLRCLLLVVTRNMTTDSPWPISTNPFAKYNDLGRPDCNLRIPLWQLVRASTAAPVFFPPEVVRLNPQRPDDIRVFVDGGITPYNNPAFLLYRMATQPAYRLNWKTGEQNILLISVGTGAAAGITQATSRNVVGNLQNLPGELMYGIQLDQDINCRTFGRCVHGAQIDREIGDLVLPIEDEKEGAKDHGRFFRYARYNADLSQAGIKALDAAVEAALDREKKEELKNIPRVGGISSADGQQMDAVDQIPNLRKIGVAFAKTELDVKMHFGPFLSTK